MSARFSVFIWSSVCLFALVVRAELPVSRLHSIFPFGGQRGTTVEISVEGTDLDDASALHFSTAGISCEPKGSGKLSVTIASNVPPGTYDARVVGRFGISNPRSFTVGTRTELSAPGTNTTAVSALTLPLDCTVNAFTTAAAADYYRFDVTASRPLTLLCRGEPFDSKMNPALVLFDASGHELKRDRRDGRLEFTPAESGSYLLKVHDLQFRGGKQFGYRLTVTTDTNIAFPARLARIPVSTFPAAGAQRERERNDNAAQQISIPAEIEGTFFPENDVDQYEFDAKKGDDLWVEVVSDRSGEPTDPFVLVQRVIKKEKEEETVEDVKELSDSDPNLGGAIFNTSTRDPSGGLEIKDDGTYRVQVRDLFNSRADHSRRYHLSIRPRTPGFELIALILPPPTFEKDKREAQVWSSFLRRNETALIKVLALRRDNFSGEITLTVDGLPPGVNASEAIVPEGQNVGWISLTADTNIANWSGAIKLVGKSKASSIERIAQAASVLWDVPDYNNETVRSRLTQETVLAISAESAPFAIESKEKTLQVAQATTLAVPLRLIRAEDFKQTVKLRAYLDGQNDPVKEWQVDGAAAETSFELDLKQTKLTPRAHQLYFLAQTSGKMRRVRPEEVSVLEARAKDHESEKKAIEEKLKLRDVSAIFSSPVLKIFVNPAPTASK